MPPPSADAGRRAKMIARHFLQMRVMSALKSGRAEVASQPFSPDVPRVFSRLTPPAERCTAASPPGCRAARPPRWRDMPAAAPRRAHILRRRYDDDASHVPVAAYASRPIDVADAP